jgi:hypothetical protein
VTQKISKIPSGVLVPDSLGWSSFFSKNEVSSVSSLRSSFALSLKSFQKIVLKIIS